MQKFKIISKNKRVILALGGESAGNFSVFKDGVIYFSKDFGDLLNEQNFSKFKDDILNFLKENEIRPDLILSDLHPLFHTTLFAQKLAKKYKAKYIPVQHHLAHIFSAIGDQILTTKTYNLKPAIGIACDGTGFGFDEKIWGGEIFELKVKSKKLKVERIGHLENQVLIGGEMAIKEPARLIISIINKFPISLPEMLRISKQAGNFQFPIKSQFSNIQNKKDLTYNLIKKHYSKNEFELLRNQFDQNFNCLETSSTARVLDAVSVLLNFSKNERLSKHGPIDLLEKNSTKPYALKPIIEFNENENIWILKTTPLFEYLIKNLHKDKSRLATTAQKYIADGLLEITKNLQPTTYNLQPVFFAGGMANNKIISSTLESNGVYTNKKIPCGDAGLSFGQIFFFLLANPRN
ncbi:MAG TPA: hypothetical protein DEA43_04585 [Candidatus Moranbacteria bacterium]|nr:hypothetical protein [Candidatus Moranbacteria bacterium]HBT46130.1 hypothetical protein [Candidatus Moranbacteria bacterium]